MSIARANQPGNRRPVEAAWEVFIKEVRARLPSYPWMDGVCVSLWFEPLRLPKPQDWPDFIAEIAMFLEPIVVWLKKFSTPDIEIPETGFPLMRQHLKFLDAGRPGIYIEWDWNGNAGSVGVTDVELCTIVAGKAEKARANYIAHRFDEQWLIVHGGWRISQFLALLDVEQLQSFAGLADLARAWALRPRLPPRLNDLLLDG